MKIKKIEEYIDSLDGPVGKNRSKRRTKYLTVMLVLIVSATLVSATLLTYFGEVQTTITVQQSIQIDGNNWDAPILHEFEGVGGCCYCFEHEITNNGCDGIWLDWNHWGVPDMEGIEVGMKECGSSCCDHILESLEVSVLDGQAQWDDFDVYVDGMLVYSYTAVGGNPETWILHTIDLTQWQFQCCGSHTISIDCTNGPWQYFNPYGQLAVDTIDLYCEDHVWCDGVDIGKPASESGHNLIGWGPIEPANTGGAYGGIDDCRVTWFWTQGDDPPSVIADASWASVELTCADCYEPGQEGCDCDSPPIDTPFYIEAGETLEFCICYELDMFLAPGIYTLYSQLVPGLEPL